MRIRVPPSRCTFSILAVCGHFLRKGQVYVANKLVRTIKSTKWLDGFFLNPGDEAPVPDDGIKPTFTERPVIRQSDDGNTITFECRLAGDPKPSVKW